MPEIAAYELRYKLPDGKWCTFAGWDFAEDIPYGAVEYVQNRFPTAEVELIAGRQLGEYE